MKIRNMGLGLALACLLANVPENACAAEPAVTPTAPATPKPVETQLDGTVVAVNPKLKVFTVDVKGKLLTINVTRDLKINRDGKIVGFEQLTAGQTVSLTFIELPNGHIEVATVTIASSPYGLEAAGSKGIGQEKRRVPVLPAQTPFSTPPNPANVGGPPVSRHK